MKQKSVCRRLCLLLCLCVYLCCVCTACAQPVGDSVLQQPAEEESAPPLAVAEGVSMLTGLPLEQSVSVRRRPVAVMVDNVRAALPQRGLSQADLVYEMVTESGITRLMAVYENYKTMPEVGPVRSARDQHVQLMLPLDALYLHVGGSTYANDMLALYRYEKKSINGYYQTGALQLDADRNASVAVEHCWFTNGAMFEAAVQAYELDDVVQSPRSAFLFMPVGAPARTLQGGAAGCVELRFSSYTSALFQYNAGTGRYDKWQFDAPQIDENTGTQLSFDNVVVLFTDVTKYPDGVLANVRYAYGGVGVYCNGGRYEEIRWLKGAPEAPLRLVDREGYETDLALNPGKTYVAVVGLDKYEHFRMRASTQLPASVQPFMPVEPSGADEDAEN